MTNLTQIIGSEKGKEGRDNVNPVDLAKEITQRLQAEKRQAEIDARKKQISNKHNSEVSPIIQKPVGNIDGVIPAHGYTPDDQNRMKYFPNDFNNSHISTLSHFKKDLFLDVANTNLYDTNYLLRSNSTVDKKVFYYYVFKSLQKHDSVFCDALGTIIEDFKKKKGSHNYQSKYQILLDEKPEDYSFREFEILLNSRSSTAFQDLFRPNVALKPTYEKEIAEISDGKSLIYSYSTFEGMREFRQSRIPGTILTLGPSETPYFIRANIRAHCGKNSEMPWTP